MRRFNLLIIVLSIFVIVGCSDDDVDVNSNLPPIPDLSTLPFVVEGSNIMFNGNEITYKGVNALQTYGLGDPELMNEWQVEMVREFIANLREQPIDGGAIQGSDGVWYHPLQAIVDQNRANNKVTILCPFGWVNNDGERQLLTGLNPSEQLFYTDYKAKMKAIAQHFKGQPDVWIELWNEPYNWDNRNNYSHDLWLSDAQDMVDNLRSVDGFESIIVVPINEQGQSEDALLVNGDKLLQGRYNLLFDLHAYEKWLVGTTEQGLIERIEDIKDRDFAFIFGEIGVENVGGLMEVNHLLNAADQSGITVLAWLWNQNSQDKNALLTDDGLPNDDINNGWGTKYKLFLER